MKYRAEIDGLRALAVVPVMLFHAGFDSFSGGYVGVDIFFVISGYLITTILINELQAGSFSLVNFYERRARRILPALFFVMACCLPFAWLLLMPRDLQDFAQSIVAVVVFASNFLFWGESGYFDTTSELKPLLHTWSLAVEEQYYIFFPLLLLGLWRFGRKAVLAIISLIFIASLIASQVWVHTDQPTAFYLLPARAWELLIGGFAAFYLQGQSRELSRPWNEGLSIAGILMIIGSVVLYEHHTPFPGITAIPPTLGTVLIILFAAKDTWTTRILSLKPLVGIGLISYSAYLWHQPLFAFYRYQSLEEPSAIAMMVLLLLTFPLAWFSWKFVEAPFRNKKKLTRGPIFAYSGLAMAAFFGIGVLGHMADGFPNRSSVKALYVGDYEPQNLVLQEESWKPLIALSGERRYRVANNAYDRELWFDEADARSKLLLVGNSHSKDLYNVFAKSQTATADFQVARYGGQIGELSDSFFALPNYQSADIIMIVSRYSATDLASFAATTERILADGKRLVLVRSIFEFPVSGHRTLSDALMIGQFRQGQTDGALIQPDLDAAHYQAWQDGPQSENGVISDRQIDALANQFDQLIILDRMDYACSAPEEVCYSVDQSLGKFYYDYGHHTLRGSAFFGQRVDRVDWLSPLIPGTEN